MNKFAIILTLLLFPCFAWAQTPAYSCSAGSFINSQLANTGQTCAPAGTVTDVSFTGGILSVATSTTTPALSVAGTSGGIPFFSSTTGWASSGLLGSGLFILGGGAGLSPTASFSVVPTANGGSGTASTLTGLMRGGSPFTASELSGDCTTSGSNVVTCPKSGGNTIVSIPAVINLTGQSAALTTQALYTPSATGYYRVSYTAKVTTAATVSSILAGTTGLSIAYTDGGDSVAQTPTLIGFNQSGSVLSVGTGNLGNSTSTITYGSGVFFAKTGVAMTYSFGYTSVGATPMQYEIYIRIEVL